MVYLEITMQIAPHDRSAAASVYKKYKQPFLEGVPGATSKELLIREDDVQVLHGFNTSENATKYLQSELFSKDVVAELKPLMQANPDVRIYEVA